MQLTPVGPAAVLVRLDDEPAPAAQTGLAGQTGQTGQTGLSDLADLAAWARDRALAREVVPGADTVLLDGVADQDRLRDLLATWTPEGETRVPDTVEIQVAYGGEDLAAVAELLGESVEAVVRRHQETTWVSRFCGFAPGFAYLGGWDRRVPRLATPRTKVPAGSVALADGWCGVYPVASPGGWQLIGRTDADLWDPTRESPALLAPGTPVRFVAAP